MNEHSFSTQNGKAYYYNTIPAFIKDNGDSIIGQLTRHSFEINVAQTDAWRNQIFELQTRLYKCGVQGDIIFEYDIVRMGKRIDVVLLIKHMVFSLEFKNGKNVFVASDAQQAEDYAIDLKNFHKESEDLYVCPILIATDAQPVSSPIGAYPDKQIYLQKENKDTFMDKIIHVADVYGDSKTLDFQKWFNSPYFPTPSIIEATVEAYQNHNVKEIAHSEAGQENIDKCEQAIDRIIQHAKQESKKAIVFVTGVPGAGKTLVGLDVASRHQDYANGEHAVYLSGNGPLVEVLRAALAKSYAQFQEARGNKLSISKAKAQTQVLIQGSFEFRKETMKNANPPAEKLVLFDEAQRVWNKEKLSDWTAKKMRDNLDQSEPQYMLSVMDRHQDWAVLICLVGLGQDIYNGEVGISEWFRSAIQDYSGWEIYYSPSIFLQTEEKIIGQKMIESCPTAFAVPELHLNTSIRSFRSSVQSQFVDALLDNQPAKAKALYDQLIKKYPLYVTRDIEKAKEWAKAQVRGSQRCGVIACSSAQRLKPYGIYVPTKLDVENWFLAPSNDLRSSNMMEMVASEFKIQGLEIDWSVMCWDADLRRKGDQWDYFNFKGNGWKHRNDAVQKRYLLNAYRVLLTRARQGMVIFVPEGVDSSYDPTRNRDFYTEIFNYLKSCGILSLESEPQSQVV